LPRFTANGALAQLVEQWTENPCVLQTLWNDELREGGRVLALETDKAFKAISSDADWAFYIQGDEVLDDKNHQAIFTPIAMHKVSEKARTKNLTSN